MRGLTSRCTYYEKNYYPFLLSDSSTFQMDLSDKAIIRNLLTKPWNLYVLRHSALTKKSQFLTEANLRSHAGWTASSKMPQVYVHLNGEHNNAILEKYGIVTKEIREKETMLKSIECPNCQEVNKHDSKLCYQCKMVLSYDSYVEVRNEDVSKIQNLESISNTLSYGMKIIEKAKFLS